MGTAQSTRSEAEPWGPSTKEGEKRVAVITGGNAGLGFECAKQMLAQGYQVVLACRNPQKATAAVAQLQQLSPGNQDVSSFICDVSSLKSVNAFASEYLSDASRKIHVLCLNAGIMMGSPRLSEDGFDLQLATNVLGHFHLVNLLRDRLVKSAPARIIHVSSIAARFGHVYFEDTNFLAQRQQNQYNSLQMYQQTKLMSVILSRELAHRLEGAGVTSNSLEPGIVKTSLSEGITDDPDMKRRLENGVSVEEGVKTHVHLATSDEVSGVTAQHWEKSRIISQGFQKFKYLIAAHDLRASVGPRLWKHLEAMLEPKLAALSVGETKEE